VEFEFFDATDGKALDPARKAAEYDEEGVRATIGRTLSENEIGCTISHRSVYRRMIAEGIGKACVLEDDILIDDAFPRTLEWLEARELRNTVVKLDNYQEKDTPCSIWGRDKLPTGASFKKPVTTQWMAWGYVLDIEAARNIMTSWPRIVFMSDDWKRMGSKVDIRCVQPAPIHQDVAFESVIDEDRKHHLEGFKDRPSAARLVRRGIHVARTLVRMALP